MSVGPAYVAVAVTLPSAASVSNCTTTEEHVNVVPCSAVSRMTAESSGPAGVSTLQRLSLIHI